MKPTEEQINIIWQKYKVACTTEDILPTKNGVRIELGGICRKTYNAWKKKSNARKKIEMLIEEAWVQRLQGNNVAGPIFYLKNAFRYRDRREFDHTTGGKPLPLLGGKTNVKNQGNNRNKQTPKAKPKD